MKKTFFLTFVLFLFAKSAFAQQPYVGEIRIFAGNFAPAGWLFCDGSLLPISENETLFSLIGTTYGGDGQSTFALPDLRGRIPVGTGQGAGTSNRILGENGGTESVALTTNNVPAHNHQSQIVVSSANGTLITPTASASLSKPGSLSGRAFVPALGYNTSAPDVLIGTVTTSSVGTSTPISLIKPFCGINYIISLYGIFPSP
jgi:microcystin-dependent protein